MSSSLYKSDKYAIICCFCFFIGLPLVLHGVGFMTPGWVVEGNCTMTGLFYNCCGKVCDFDNTYMTTAALGLQATSFAILLLGFISLTIELCFIMIADDSNDNDDDVTCLGISFVCSLLSYPVSGLLNLIGCILVAVNKSTSSTLGYSFYLAIAAGCIVFLQVVIGCIFLRLIYKESESQPQHDSMNDNPVASSEETAGHNNTWQMTVDEEAPTTKHAISSITTKVVRKLRANA